MPKGRSWKKAELDASRARNKAMVASKHRYDPIAPLALSSGAENNLKSYKGVVMINEDRLVVMETERDAARDAAAARSAELDAEKHVAQFQLDELRRKLADAEAAKARLAREVEELRRKVAVAVTPVRAAVVPYTPAAPGDVARGAANVNDSAGTLGSVGGSGGGTGERILLGSAGGSVGGRDSCDGKSDSQSRSVPSTSAAPDGHKRPKRICQKNPPPRFSLGDVDAGFDRRDSNDDEKDEKDDEKKDEKASPERRRFKIPSSPGLETLATEAVEERRRSLSRSPSPIPVDASPVPVGAVAKRRRGRPPGSKNKRKAIEPTIEDFDEEGVDIVFEVEDEEGNVEAPAPAPVLETVHVVGESPPGESPPVVKRKRGRPKGSKNKTTTTRERFLFDVTNRDSDETKDEKRTVAEEEPDRTSLAAQSAGVVKRGRGRPKGSKNKKKVVHPDGHPTSVDEGESGDTVHAERARKRRYTCKGCGECGHSVKTCGRVRM